MGASSTGKGGGVHWCLAVLGLQWKGWDQVVHISVVGIIDSINVTPKISILGIPIRIHSLIKLDRVLS